ncbi:MAG: type I methionyl aminopeptidase [Saccharofermentans sp.]|jgi:methionyl aminopeptidase|nr:type I methionyl aminopeptidase [Mageeibacillus sp.]MCI1264477.1 type I methionyl aminopeptidase [Saccharofermentans sp.]MCI1275550.1 type I methionyl aminopeptidase [Saccharofermentans sp.]MCI1768839.1 type I methionyl aminopeptidase [Mageeibacillus sp.]
MVEILTDDEFEMMKESGKILQEVFKTLRDELKPGMSTHDVDKIAYGIIRSHDAIPSFLNFGQPPFPGTICASVNEAVVHGIPRKSTVLNDGDILSVDVGAILNGYHSDACRTYLIGDVAPEVKDLVKRTEESFFVGLELAKAGNRTGDIGEAIAKYCEGFGYGVVRELTGHGIGTSMHQDPDVPNYGKAGHGYKLKKGMAICIEPMITLGSRAIEMLGDEWTIVTRDGKPASHYENTILITENGPYMTTYDYEEGF